MAKRVRIKLEFEAVCFDDQVEFAKDTLIEDLKNAVHHWHFETEVEDTNDHYVDNFFYEMRDLDNEDKEDN